MSASVEDEARARLDVAQLYEEMNQIPKAVRYYLEAAQIYKDGGVQVRYKEMLTKVLQLDPENAQAQTEMNRVNTPPPATYAPTARPAAPAPSKPGGNSPSLPPLQMPTPQAGKVLCPTPWLFRDPRYVQSAKKQLTQAVDRNELQFDPLPKVDPQMVMLKQEQRKKAEEEAARRANPRVVSAFADRPSPFASNQGGEKKPGGLFGGAASSGPRSAPGTPAPQEQPAASRFGMGGGRSGNQDLAEQIQRRLRERGGS